MTRTLRILAAVLVVIVGIVFFAQHTDTLGGLRALAGVGVTLSLGFFVGGTDGDFWSNDDLIKRLIGLGVADTRGLFQGNVQTKEGVFTENGAAGVYTVTVPIPAKATIVDIIVSGVALWTAGTSATLKVGDANTSDGYFTAVDLKATDLLAGEQISLALAGGKAGSYIAASQANKRYSDTARVVAGVVTTVGTPASTGVTRMTVVYSLPSDTDSVAATKV